MKPLLDQIQTLLDAGGTAREGLESVLTLVLKEFRSETGTIHWLDSDKQMLELAADVGLPDALRETVRRIPVGKGIAGQTVARNGPVTICNLQADTTGTARPGARQTGVGGALCVPMRDANAIVGTLGIGTVRQYEYSTAETELLTEVGRLIAAKSTLRKKADE